MPIAAPPRWRAGGRLQPACRTGTFATPGASTGASRAGFAWSVESRGQQGRVGRGWEAITRTASRDPTQTRALPREPPPRLRSRVPRPPIATTFSSPAPQTDCTRLASGALLLERVGADPRGRQPGRREPGVLVGRRQKELVGLCAHSSSHQGLGLAMSWALMFGAMFCSHTACGLLSRSSLRSSVTSRGGCRWEGRGHTRIPSNLSAVLVR